MSLGIFKDFLSHSKLRRFKDNEHNKKNKKKFSRKNSYTPILHGGPETPPCYLFNNSVKREPILIILMHRILKKFG